uniref:Uncharacterized protein n=1 Tax=Rhizophora mucronata TaxID=61149 RepID=A0A2P2N4A5_RHIMU
MKVIGNHYNMFLTFQPKDNLQHVIFNMYKASKEI